MKFSATNDLVAPPLLPVSVWRRLPVGILPPEGSPGGRGRRRGERLQSDECNEEGMQWAVTVLHTVVVSQTLLPGSPSSLALAHCHAGLYETQLPSPQSSQIGRRRRS